jgi:hypothetical protein
MASDSISEVRIALEAGLDEVQPQIKGCINKIPDTISADLKASFQARLVVLQTREAQIKAALAALESVDGAMDVLEDAGFPTLPPMEIPASQFQEIKEEGAADDAAAAGFVATPMATGMNVTLGTPTDKP